jgi:butyryl-CoA dehydrogenase
MTFTAHVDDLRHTLSHVVGLPQQIEAGLLGDLDADLVDAVLEEAGRFATEVIAPLNRVGDIEGTRRDGDAVIMPPGWKDAYRQWAEAGWGGLPCPPEFGGQGLPMQIGLAAQELWNSASMAFGIGTVLTHGAVEAIRAHGTRHLQDLYLPKLISGEWTGTMNLTEPQAGSDLAALRARAEPRGDGTYAITGTKIFITYGDHDFTENIAHLVLARLPDAPPGTRGISLFLVPKVLVNGDGSLGGANDVKCAGVEHKLGIHASPTCVMAFGENGGAAGWLIGEENRGLACMFTMMNSARLHVGMQGVAIAERAWQQARAYAHERRQGRRPGTEGMVAVVEHPDVKRMLMTMKALTAAARAICFSTARAIDLSHLAGDEAERQDNRALADLLTPVAKAFSTDVGVEVASLGVQVHGGMGFIEETGAAQHFRDARIAPIYEGTNGIQAIDLVTRKLPMEDGAVVDRFISALRDDVGRVMASNDPGFGQAGYRLSAAVDALEEATDWLLRELGGDQDRALAGATPYLRLFGLTAGGVAVARGALAATKAGDGSAPARVNLARFLAENLATEAPGLAATATGGGGALADMPAEQLAL